MTAQSAVYPPSRMVMSVSSPRDFPSCYNSTAPVHSATASPHVQRRNYDYDDQDLDTTTYYEFTSNNRSAGNIMTNSQSSNGSSRRLLPPLPFENNSEHLQMNAQSNLFSLKKNQ